MKTKENSTVFQIAITAGFASLTLFLGITHLGLIPLSPIVSLTIMHTPVILAAIMGGLWSGIGVGFVFGIYSLIQAAIHPSGMLDPLFVNPLVSVLPRMLIGVAAWGIHRLLKMIPKMPRVLSSSIAAFFGSLTNTIFVIGAIYLLYRDAAHTAFGGAGYIAGLILLGPSVLMEAVAAVIITALVISAIYFSGNRKSKLMKEAEGKDPLKTQVITGIIGAVIIIAGISFIAITNANISKKAQKAQQAAVESTEAGEFSEVIEETAE